MTPRLLAPFDRGASALTKGEKNSALSVFIIRETHDRLAYSLSRQKNGNKNDAASVN
ncbi:MAG: hypothetical protein IT172_07375 [Acidobacteria bacterium]|nr:hypothetical protein [Acidobacteriota bacterium]